MRAIPSFRPAALAVAFAFASTTGVLAFERILPAPRIKDNGEVRLSDDLRIGRFQGGKFISQPDAVQIQGPGSTGPIDAMTVGGLALSTALGSKAPNASPIFTGIAGFNAFQGGYPGGAVDPPSYALSRLLCRSMRPRRGRIFLYMCSLVSGSLVRPRRMRRTRSGGGVRHRTRQPRQFSRTALAWQAMDGSEHRTRTAAPGACTVRVVPAQAAATAWSTGPSLRSSMTAATSLQLIRRPLNMLRF